MRVLMVCTGNICRSPTAAAVFSHMASTMQLSDRVDTDSCGHLRELNRLCPKEYAHKLRLFLDDVTNDGNVPDPYYGGTRDFEHALDLIKEGSSAWLTRIASDNWPD